MVELVLFDLSISPTPRSQCRDAVATASATAANPVIVVIAAAIVTASSIILISLSATPTASRHL